MKKENVLKLSLTILSFVVSMMATSGTVSAHSYTYWLHPHWVTVTKTTTIAKNKNTYPLYKSYMVKEYKVYPGHHLKVHHAASYDWVVESGKFNTNSHYTYAVEHGSSTSWFKQGIHKLASKKKAPKKNVPKYKSFHGYRVENIKGEATHNTYYVAGTNSILSEYRPTDTSKVIFRYGSHVIPTEHDWNYAPAQSDSLITYQYKDGAWKIKATY